MIQELKPYCEKISARLPEILWRLPVWPKGYLNAISPGLFIRKPYWTPYQAVAEVEMNLQQLQSMGVDSRQAQFLSQKIEKQIEVLVMLGKKMRVSGRLYLQPGLTRAQHQSRLWAKKNELLAQKHALQVASKQSLGNLMTDDLEQLDQHLLQIEELISRT